MEKRKRVFWIATVAVFGILAVAVGASVFVADSGQATEDVEGVSTFENADDFRGYLANAPSSDSGVRVAQTERREQGENEQQQLLRELSERLEEVVEQREQLEEQLNDSEDQDELEQEISQLEDRQAELESALEEQTQQLEQSAADAEADRGSFEQAAPSDGDGGAAGGGGVERESDTNVQVEGIDEPDIMKTSDGRLFYSSNPEDETKVIDALPADEMDVTENISEAGEMLLGEDGETLVALRNDEMVGYDISGSPSESWTAELDDGIVEARMYGGSVYVVLSDAVDREEPCPIRPMSVGGEDVVVPCDDIHRPDEPTDVDTTYTVVGIDAETGETQGETSFVGSAAKTVVYMSRGSAYVTYTREMSEADIMLDFALGEGRDIFDATTIERLEQLEGYDLSDRAKRVEIQSILEDWRDSLDEDERIRAENEFENRMQDYMEENLRELETTGIVRTDLESFEVTATGEVPGYPLNQFALDEHNGDLRIATTVGESLSRQESENDVYVLDENLERRSAAQGMGEGQRVYSVRFMGDTGYVVTFRQVDPFYVLDMSNPDDVSVEGELKLPGYSSYLHPLGEDRVLGVGEESGNVKAVIFDASDPTDPTIEDDYVLEEYSSDAVGNHRAFLHDERHDVFFLPGSQAGYVFSYDDGLELEKAVNVTQSRRAAYINDNMYIASDYEVVALDENDWSRIGRVEIGEREPVVRPPRPIEPPVEPMPRPDVDR